MRDGPGVAALLAEHAAARPDAVFLEDARSDRALTFRDVAGAAGAWSRALDALPPDASVLVAVRDPVALAVALLAVIASGRRAVAADPDAGTDALRTVADRADGVAAQIRDADGAVVADLDLRILTTGLPADAAPAPVRPDLPAGRSLLFTSGSSGVPKGVDLAEHRLLAVARAVVANEARTERDRGFNPLPLVHVNAQVVGLLATLVSGGAVVLDRRFKRTGFWPLLADRRITWLNAVPAILAVLAKDDIAVPPTLRYIRSASAPLPEPVRAAFARVPFVVSWGMTEAASQITATPPEDESRGDVGRPLGTEVVARDEHGADLPAGERGALWIRGEGVVREYAGGVAADRFDAAGWLRTGDEGEIGPDGRVRVAGRTDDVINRGGELVDPAEIEAVLVADPRVREAAALGRPDDVLGQVPVALVLPDGEVDAAALVDDLTDRVARVLPAFKRPVRITVVADLPRSAAGKVSRSRALAAIDDGA